MLKKLTVTGFKSFGKKTELSFGANVTAIVGPNGSGKSNISDSFRWVLGEQSFKSIRGKRGEDFIYHGSSALPRSGQAQVTVVFDNKDRRFDIDYDEVIISRKVFRDGVNEYYLNNSKVRLKDIIELLASIGIGASSHHIISQGEADRFLLARPDERRVMIEDALGIKIYQYKKVESERKLQKTEANTKEVESLRRELAPHIKYLKKQVDKIEKAQQLQTELTGLYQAHFKAEDAYVTHERASLASQREPLVARIREVDEGIRIAQKETEAFEHGAWKELEGTVGNLLQKINAERQRKEEAYRALGRIEGALSALSRTHTNEPKDESVRVLLDDIRDLDDTMSQLMSEAGRLEDHARMRSLFERAGEVLRHFVSRYTTGSSEVDEKDRDLDIVRLQEEVVRHEEEVSHATAEANRLEQERAEYITKLEESKDAGRDARLSLVALQGERGELVSRQQYIDRESALLDEREARNKQEIGEAHVLVGRGVVDIEGVVDEVFDKVGHEARWRKIERMKIQLEDLGGDSEGTMREYEQITERDEHLSRELIDLTQSAEKLNELIQELTKKLDTEFQRGVKEINNEFGRFFALLFGSGSAKLRFVRPELTEEEQALGIEAKEGVDIDIDMPKKRIRSLAMLSGGERTLASLALLFAIAHVNPPPFMILDETDAALDEVNSKKYGEMVEDLARGSQLIIITHNRETMSHAGVLYGVTMGGDGSSKILSLQFEEVEGT
ncbi:MAG: AAA family ATPase [bacterium]|nr:AAA family ATPase [bacterium]